MKINDAEKKKKYDEIVNTMWLRIEAMAQEMGVSVRQIFLGAGVSISACSEAIRIAKAGGEPKDTDLGVIRSIAAYLGLSLDALLLQQGETEPTIAPEEPAQTTRAREALSICNGSAYELLVACALSMTAEQRAGLIAALKGFYEQ